MSKENTGIVHNLISKVCTIDNKADLISFTQKVSMADLERDQFNEIYMHIEHKYDQLQFKSKENAIVVLSDPDVSEI